MNRDLRVVSTRLDAQVAVGPERVELVGGEVGQSLQRRRLPASEPEATLALGTEQRRTESEGDGQSRRGQPNGLAGVVRWCRVRARCRSELPAGRPWAMRPAAVVQSLRSCTNSSRESVIT